MSDRPTEREKKNYQASDHQESVFPLGALLEDLPGYFLNEAELCSVMESEQNAR